MWFEGEVPESELRHADGVTLFDVRGVEVTGVVKGSPTVLRGARPSSGVTYLVLPEPDLEDAFLSYYAEDST